MSATLTHLPEIPAPEMYSDALAALSAATDAVLKVTSQVMRFEGVVHDNADDEPGVPRVTTSDIGALFDWVDHAKSYLEEMSGYIADAESSIEHMNSVRRVQQYHGRSRPDA